MPTQPTPYTDPNKTQETDAIDPNALPDKTEWHTWIFLESPNGLAYQHEFGQGITQRDATDRILKLHGLSTLPEGAKVYHEEAMPVPEAQPEAQVEPVPTETPVVSETTSSPDTPDSELSQI